MKIKYIKNIKNISFFSEYEIIFWNNSNSLKLIVFHECKNYIKSSIPHTKVVRYYKLYSILDLLQYQEVPAFIEDYIYEYDEMVESNNCYCEDVENTQYIVEDGLILLMDHTSLSITSELECLFDVLDENLKNIFLKKIKI